VRIENINPQLPASTFSGPIRLNNACAIGICFQDRKRLEFYSLAKISQHLLQR